jgi:hypothetical protein
VALDVLDRQINLQTFAVGQISEFFVEVRDLVWVAFRDAFPLLAS